MYPINIWVKAQQVFKSLKLDCSDKRNVGAISYDQKHCYLNVNNLFPKPFLTIILSDPRFLKSTTGSVMGNGGGRGYLGCIPFADEFRLRSYLFGIGLNVFDCAPSCGGQDQVPEDQVPQDPQITLWVKAQQVFKSLKLNCSDWKNVGAISYDQEFFYLNVNNKLPEPFLTIILSDPRFLKSTTGSVMGNGGGSGYLGYIDFADEVSLRSYLTGIGLNLSDCDPFGGPQEGGPQEGGPQEGGPQGGGPQGGGPQGGGPQGGGPQGHSFNFIQLVQSWKTPFGSSANDFESFYKHVVESMDKQKRYKHFCPADNNGLNWPKCFGVYVVRMKQLQTNFSDGILYVGMTGKFNNAGKIPPGLGLANRVYRVMPYSFTVDSTGCRYFEYGPKASSVKGVLQLKPSDRYSSKIEMTKLLVDCFTVDRNGLDAPAFLEAVILQAYLLSNKKLPAANNSF